MSLFEWFKNVFLPNASDGTLAILFYLYDKYYGDKKLSCEEIDFIREEMRLIKALPYRGDDLRKN